MIDSEMTEINLNLRKKAQITGDNDTKMKDVKAEYS